MTTEIYGKKSGKTAIIKVNQKEPLFYVPGEALELAIKIPGKIPVDIKKQYEATLTETFSNDVLEGMPKDSDYDVDFNVDLTANEAMRLASELIAAVTENSIVVRDFHSKMNEFLRAQMSCLRGQIGKLEVHMVAESDKKDLGFAFYTLKYFNDVEEGGIMYEVEHIHMLVPPSEDLQMDWLRGLVGGNHPYTSSIAIQLVGFSFQEITDAFNARHHLVDGEDAGTIIVGGNRGEWS